MALFTTIHTASKGTASKGSALHSERAKNLDRRVAQDLLLQPMETTCLLQVHPNEKARALTRRSRSAGSGSPAATSTTAASRSSPTDEYCTYSTPMPQLSVRPTSHSTGTQEAVVA